MALATVVGTRDVPVAPGLLRIDTVWGDHAGLDLLGSTADVVAWVAQSGLPTGTHEELEVLRIEAGVPAQGVDVDELDDPAGGVPRGRRGVVHEGLLHRPGAGLSHRLARPRQPVPAPPRAVRCRGAAHGADVTYDGKAVGGITSAVAVPGENRVVALAMVRREVEPPAEVTVTVAGTEVPATLLV